MCRNVGYVKVSVMSGQVHGFQLKSLTLTLQYIVSFYLNLALIRTEMKGNCVLHFIYF